jgi:hypothetical protein
MSYLDLLNDDLLGVVSDHLKTYEILCLLEAKGNSPSISILKKRLLQQMDKCSDCNVPEFLDNDPDCWKCHAILCGECFHNNMIKCAKCGCVWHKICMENCSQCSLGASTESLIESDSDFF